MDLSSIAEFVKNHLLIHWPFIFVSLMLGMLGQFFKTRVWTQRRVDTTRNDTLRKVLWFMRATLPLHAPFAGFVLGLVGVLILGDATPASPGVTGGVNLVIYHTSAGMMSSWVVNALKHFAQSQGIMIPSEFSDEVTPVETPAGVRKAD